jgi:hypothetical protein
MKQILHIFRKDTRRFWLEILISVALTFAFAVVDANDWKVFHDPQTRNRMQAFIAILVTLMAASWWLLVARVVHAETLVGDRQFWITRPYEWKKLLLAKVLFVAVWLGVPYLLSQCLLLSEAGFHPVDFVPGLLSTVLVGGLVIVLPVWSIAAVTATFARLVLTTLGCLVAFFGYMYLIQFPHGYASYNPYPNPILFPLLFVGCAVAIVLEYATRRVWVARGLLIALPIMLAISVWVYGRQSLVDKAYPWPGAGSRAPVSISLSPLPANPIQTRSWAGNDYMDLPLKFADVTSGYAVFTDDFKFTLTAADGSEWTSPWEVTRDRLVPGVHQSGIGLMIPPGVYDRFKAGPVTLRVYFALSRYRAGMATQMAFPAGDVAVPGIGFCEAQSWGLTALQCRSAIDQPPLTYLALTWRKGACDDGAPLADAVAEGYSWLEPQGLDFSMISVRTLFMWFRRGTEDDPAGRGWRICPGTPMTLTQFHLVDRTRTELTLPGFALPAKVVATD